MVVTLASEHDGTRLQSGQGVPHTPGARAPHVWGMGQVGLQLSVPPQPSPTSPQRRPPIGLQTLSVHMGGIAPHTLGVPEGLPPQVQPG